MEDSEEQHVWLYDRDKKGFKWVMVVFKSTIH